jgi:hypothetical protein
MKLFGTPRTKLSPDLRPWEVWSGEHGSRLSFSIFFLWYRPISPPKNTTLEVTAGNISSEYLRRHAHLTNCIHMRTTMYLCPPPSRSCTTSSQCSALARLGTLHPPLHRVILQQGRRHRPDRLRGSKPTRGEHIAAFDLLFLLVAEGGRYRQVERKTRRSRRDDSCGEEQAIVPSQTQNGGAQHVGGGRRPWCNGHHMLRHRHTWFSLSI